MINKLLWARESSSERQLADVHAILALENVETDADFKRWIAAYELQPTLEPSKETRYER